MLLDPDPHSKHRSGSKKDTWMRIHVNPDPQHWKSFSKGTKYKYRHWIVNVSIVDEKNLDLDGSEFNEYETLVLKLAMWK